LVNGYKLCNDLRTNKGEPISAIERNDEIVFVRAQQEEKNPIDPQLAYKLAKTHPGFMSFQMLTTINKGYSTNIDLIHFSDFFLSKLCLSQKDVTESERLCSAYIQYMSKKFPTYKSDYIKFYNQSQSKTEEEYSL